MLGRMYRSVMSFFGRHYKKIVGFIILVSLMNIDLNINIDLEII